MVSLFLCLVARTVLGENFRHELLFTADSVISKQFRNVLFWQFRNVRFRGGVIHKSIAHSRLLTAREIWSCGPCG